MNFSYKLFISVLLVIKCSMSHAQEKPLPGDYINIMYIVDDQKWISVPGKVDQVKDHTIGFTGLLDKQKLAITYEPLPNGTINLGIGSHLGKMAQAGSTKIPKNAELITAFFRADYSKSYEGPAIKTLLETIKDDWGYCSGFVLAEFPDGFQAPLFVQQTDDIQDLRMYIISNEKVFHFSPTTFTLTKSYLPAYKPGTRLKLYAVKNLK